MSQPSAADVSGVDNDEDVRLQRLAAWDVLVQSKKAAPTTRVSLRRSHDADVLPSQRPLTPDPPSPPLAHTPASGPSQPSLPVLSPAAAWEKLSHIRLKSLPTSSSVLLPQVQRCKVVSFDGLERHASASSSTDPKNWVVFGVVAHASPIKHTAKGEKFLIWTLTDLRGHLVSLFLFAAAFSAHWREEPGTVVVAANPKLLPKQSQASSAAPSAASSTFVSSSLSISAAAQLLVLGPALDFGYCAAYKNAPNPSDSLYPTGPSASMQRCRNTVDLRKSKFCDYHVAAEYRKIAGARVGLNKTVSERSGVVHFSGSSSGAGLPPGKRPLNQHSGNIKGGLSLLPGLVTKVTPSGPTPLMEKLQEALKEDAIKFGAKAVAAASPSAASGPRIPQRFSSSSSASHIAKPFTPLSAAASAVAQRPPLTQLAALPAPSVSSAQSPFVSVKRPRPLSAEETVKELRRLKALQQLQTHGPVSAPDPNASSLPPPSALQAQRDRERKRSKTDHPTARLAGDGGLIMRVPVTISAPGPAARPPSPPSSRRVQLEALFGPVDLESAQGKALLAASPAHVALMQAMAEEERMEYLEYLANKEELLVQMQGITQQKCAVWQCVTEGCGKRSEAFPALCKEKGHELEKRDAVRRWFECGGCRARVSVVDKRLPFHCCHKCGRSEWKQSGMVSASSGMAASVRSELQHKSEEVFSLRAINGDAMPVSRNDVPSRSEREK